MNKIDKDVNNNPLFLNDINDTLILSLIDYGEYEAKEKILVEDKEISIDLVRDFLKKQEYYSYVLKLFNGEIKKLKVCTVVDNKLSGTLTFTKVDIFLALQKLIKDNTNLFIQEDLEKYQRLANLVDFNKFLNIYAKESFKLNIEGKIYQIPIITLISFMNLEEEKFKYYCTLPSNAKINGIEKDYFIYAAYVFVKMFIKDNYLMTKNYYHNYLSIKNSENVDILAINRYLKIEDPNILEISLNEELEATVLKDMPSSLNTLEKVIYIYIKLCRLLTYDNEFFAVKYNGKDAMKHKEYAHIKEINPNNNEIVCYEFNAIYAKFLQKLQINFKTTQALEKGFGGHASLVMRVSKFLIKADAVSSTINGDLLNAKVARPLIGFICLNQNKDTLKEFNEALFKVYNLILEMDDIKQNITVIEDLKSILKEYQVTKSINGLTDKEKMDLLIRRVNSKNLPPIEMYGYLLKLKDVFFTKEEKEENISITLIRKYDKTNNTSVTWAIIAINGNSMQNNNSYYYYDNLTLNPISKEEIEKNFLEGTFSYIDDLDPRIPGVLAINK